MSSITPPRRALLRAALGAACLLAGCASMEKSTRQRQVASLLSYLYPGADKVPPASDAVAELRVPFRVGIAFVPDTAPPEFRLSEVDRQGLARQVREAFARYPFIAAIEPVPSMYLEPGGGFENLERVAALLRLDVVALVSYDQVQHAGANKWSFLYWTGVGAYVVDGDEYDVLTAVETAVFDVRSRRLLMRAAGVSRQSGEASWVRFGERARQARTEGFQSAVRQMIEQLQGEVKGFRERAARDPGVRLVLPAGYDPGGGQGTARP